MSYGPMKNQLLILHTDVIESPLDDALDLRHRLYGRSMAGGFPQRHVI